jgi:hypothetical protein
MDKQILQIAGGGVLAAHTFCGGTAFVAHGFLTLVTEHEILLEYSWAKPKGAAWVDSGSVVLWS